MAPMAKRPRGTPTPAPMATFEAPEVSCSTGTLVAEACVPSLLDAVGLSLGTEQEALSRRALLVMTSPSLMRNGSVFPAQVMLSDELETIELAQYKAVPLRKL